MGTLIIMVRRVLVAAWRYRWAALALSWIVCSIGWAYIYTIPNQYEANARLYVDADAVLTPLLRGLAADSSVGSQLDVLQRTLLSRPNLEKLVSNTDLDLLITGPSDLESMVDRLANDIKITPQTRNLFTITYRNSSPKLAFDVVQSILTTFIESGTGNNRSEMENAQLFLQQQLAVYERQLRDAEKKRADFRAKYIDLLPMGDSGVNRLDQAESSIRQLQGQLEDETANRDMINHELASTSPLIATETVIGPGGQLMGHAVDPRVEAAQQQLEDLRLRYTENDPDVVTARNRLAALKASAAAEATQALAAVKANPATGTAAATGAADEVVTRDSHSLPNPIYEQLRVRLLQSQSTLASLQRQIADATRQRDRLEEIARSEPGLQAEYVNINRDYDVLRKNYEELLARRESMRIATAAEADADKIKIQIIDPPQVPQNPVAPNRVKLMSAVLFAGIVAGLGLAVLLVQFDQSFHTIDELRDLGLPVAGGISLLNVTVVRGRLTSALLFGMALILLGAAYAGLIFRMMHTPGMV
jgi:polysaccharide chain length determinant protein (PEP-CTERM system associated)